MVDLAYLYESEIGLVASVLGIVGTIVAFFYWLITRNKPVKIVVANPEALLPPLRANLIEMTRSEFIALTNEWRDRAYSERDKLYGHERAVLEDKIAELNRRLANPDEALAQQHAKIVALEETLDRLGNTVSSDRITAAKAALIKGDFSLADSLFAEVEAAEELAVHTTARAAFGRGEVAEAEIRWHDAARHYARAATLAPDFDRLYKATHFAIKAGHYDQADRFAADLVDVARTAASPENLSRALDRQATVLQRKGMFAAAEVLFTNALELDRATIGEAHPAYSTCLNNLAGVVQAQGRYPEAEGLFRQALKIGRATIGEAHPHYAIHLNNLAGVVHAQGQYPEAEGLYRQALEIDRATIGEAHPDYAIHLNNLAGAIQDQGRAPEAEALSRQALEVDRATIGEIHPDYAIHLTTLAHAVLVQGRTAEAGELYAQCLLLFRFVLGDQHPDTQRAARGFLNLLRAQNPTSPDIAVLEALLIPEP